MSLNFLPSLQHLAAVKVALTVYNNDFIHLFDELVLPYKVGKHIFNKRLERWIRKRRNKSRKKLSKLLPELLQNCITDICQPLVNEIYLWTRDHFNIIKHIDKSHYRYNLCWKLDGTIDKIKTAKQFIRNENIDWRFRFVMACIYFLEKDVLHLWQNMKKDERERIHLIDSYIAVEFWLEWLRRKARYPLTRCITEYFDNNARRELRYYGMHKKSRIRLSSFFAELNSVSKKDYFFNWWPQHMHNDDLRLCYFQVDEIERVESPCFLSYSKLVLCCYLDWPLQSLFLDAVNDMKNILMPSCFEHILNYIVDQKLMRGMQDFDYLQLLRDFWEQIPDVYKEDIQKESIFTLVYAAMSYDAKTHPLLIGELLKACTSFTDALPV